MKSALAAFAGAWVLGLVQLALAEQPPLTVTERLTLPNPERIAAMRLDPSSGRLLIAQGDLLTILDDLDGRIRRRLRLSGEPTSLAIAPQSGLAVVVLEDQHTLALLDLDEAALKSSFQSAIKSPSVAAFDAAADKFFVASNREPGLVAIDPGSGAQEVYETGSPLVTLQATGRGWLFGAAADAPAVLVFDSFSGREMGRIAAPGCRHPSDLALDDVERRLYLSCANGIFLALDSDTGVILNRQELGAGESSLALRQLENRIIQVMVLIEGRSLALIEGRITANGLKGILGGLESAGELQIDPDSGRILLATGSTVSSLEPQ